MYIIMAQGTIQSGTMLIQLAITNDEHQKLKQENDELRIQLAEMRGQKIALEEQLTQKQFTIEELKKENTKLQQKIQELEDKNEALDRKVNIIIGENNELKLERLKSKYLEAIQDANSFGDLECEINIKYKNALRRLRKNRVAEHHYIIYDKKHPDAYDDTPEEINYKIKVLLDKLRCMPIEIIRSFDKKFGDGLINELINTIQKIYDGHKNEPSQEDCQDIMEYWNIGSKLQ